MQIVIDTNADTPDQLAAAARFLLAIGVPGCAEPQPKPAATVGEINMRLNVDTRDAQLAEQSAVADQVRVELVEQQDPAAVFTAGAATPAPAAAETAPATTPPEQNSSATTSPASGGGVEVDRDGLPWDARIHSSSRTKIADGTWKKKRGVHDSIVAGVTEQLRAVMAAGRGESAFHADTGTAEMDAALRADQAKLEALGAVAPTGLFPTPTQQPSFPLPPATTAAALDFAGLMQLVTAAQTAGKLTPLAIMDAVRSVGLNALPDLIHRPDLVPAVGAKIQEATGAA